MSNPLLTLLRWSLAFALMAVAQVHAQVLGPDQFVTGIEPDSLPARLEGLDVVPPDQWTPVAVRRVLQSFAFGGHATDRQIALWAAMPPELAVAEMLDFKPQNWRLSRPDPIRADEFSCTSLTELQRLWGSDDPLNPARESDRRFYALLSEERLQLSPLGLYLVWPRAMHTRGCNLFLHKMAFYLTNYHASIHVQNAGVGLIRDYYDDTVAALIESSSFVDLMHRAARNGAVALAYGHFASYVHPFTGEFVGNDDFAREYFQLLFGIQGVGEDPEYHEGVTIENNAKLLTGMFLDSEPGRFGSESRFDWFLSGIDFSDHTDALGREIYNRSLHFDFRKGINSCLEMLRTSICGGTADEKLRALGWVAAAHPESMANTPLKIVRFFGDTVITPDEALALQAAWRDAGFDLLRFVRAYAISTLFHSPDTFKHWSSFERNLIVHNATILDNQESFAKPFHLGPVVPMFEQGALAFAPIRDVFGGQTGNDAANDRFGFRNALRSNVENPDMLAVSELRYSLGAEGMPQHWQKHWQSVIPRNQDGKYIVAQVADWLWQRYIADGGENFDPVARANVYSLLATGFDFAAIVDRGRLDAVYGSAELEAGYAGDVARELAAMEMNFADPDVQRRVGMAVNFITMMPYAFATTGMQP